MEAKDSPATTNKKALGFFVAQDAISSLLMLSEPCGNMVKAARRAGRHAKKIVKKAWVV